MPLTHEIKRIYDSLDRVLEEQQDSEPTSSIWSGDGNREQLQYPTSRILEYEFDAVNRIKTVTDPGPMPETVANYNWIGPGSRPLLLALGNGTEMSFLNAAGDAASGYDDVKEVVGLRHLEGASWSDSYP